VGFGCGWAKLNVLQKRWLVCRLAALLILRRVGILSTVFLSVYVSTVGLLGLLTTPLYMHHILPKGAQSQLFWHTLYTFEVYNNKEPRRKQRGILKKILSYFTPQEAGNMTHRDSNNRFSVSYRTECPIA